MLIWLYCMAKRMGVIRLLYFKGIQKKYIRRRQAPVLPGTGPGGWFCAKH